MKRRPTSCVALLLLLLAGCGAGGTETGNPTGTISGQVGATSADLSTDKAASDFGCGADEVRATDAANATTTVQVGDSCAFQLTLVSDRGYMLSFWQRSTVRGVLRMNHNVSFGDSPVLPFFAAGRTVELGAITIAEQRAVPAREPASQLDRDGDGLSDRDDPDDDNDGTADEDERDCDLDGFHDDFDPDIAACTAETTTAQVRDVIPGHDAARDTAQRKVGLTRTIRARFSCAIDTATLTDTTFTVRADNDSISCTLTIASGNHQVACVHATDPFLADTTYTATIDGVRCADGQAIQARNWSWHTRTR